MIELFVNIDNKEVAALLKKLPQALRDDAPAMIGQIGAKLTKKHITGIARSRHRSGSPRNFYQKAADAVVSDVVTDGAEITIDHTGFALRYHGGRVEPSGRTSLITGRPIRRLTIPIKGSEAEGKTAGDFDDMFAIKGRRSGTAFLAGKKSNGMIGLLFALVKYTDHDPDPSILPTDADYQAAATDGIGKLLNEVK